MAIKRIPSVLQLAAATLFCVVTTACSYPDSTYDPAELDYRVRYPIGVKSQVVEADFYGAAQGGLTGDEQRTLQQFVAAYMERGQKPITVTMGGGGQNGQALADALRQAALDQGLAASEVLVGVDPSQPDDHVQMSFLSYTAEVPECGYWSDESISNHANINSLNFGCASQHNLGLMLADPSDLLGKTEMPPRDATRSVTGNQKYQTGEDPSAVWPTGTANSIIDTAQ